MNTAYIFAIAAGASMAAAAGAATIDLGMQSGHRQLTGSGFAAYEPFSSGIGAAPALAADDFAALAGFGIADHAGVVPTGIALRAAEFVGRLGRIEPRDDYGPRGAFGAQGGFGGVEPAPAHATARYSINRDKFSYQVTNLPGTIPEPERWAMLIVGFGLTGGAMRWRRRNLYMQRAPVLARPARRRR